MKAKKCPICDSADLQYVYYAPSAKDEPTLWEDMPTNIPESEGGE